MSYLKNIVRIFIASFLLSHQLTFAQANPERIGKLKAASLFYLAKFVTWPNETVDTAKSLKVCTLGDDEINLSIKSILSGKTVKQRELEVLFLEPRNLGNLSTQCDILYLGKIDSETGFNRSFIANRSILTVSMAIDSNSCENMVCFINSDNKLRIAIHLAATKKAGLNVSSELLKLAEIVD